MCQILADDVRFTMIYTIEKEEKFPWIKSQVCEEGYW